jgi:hypothetical protein
MVRKYFPFDKNYLLEQAQFSEQDSLLNWFIDECKQFYLREYNPLGLMDDTALCIRDHQTIPDTRLHQFYADLSGVYRYRYGDNQLEFLFDGTDHSTKYREDWVRAFKSWTRQLCQSPYFLKAILEITVFNKSAHKVSLAEGRLKFYVEKNFNLRLYIYRGIHEMRVA